MISELVLAIDIGGTSIKIGVVKKDIVLENTSIRNTFKGKSEIFLIGIKDTIDYFINKYNINKIGIGCPGNIKDGIILFASNLGWKNYDILKDFQTYYPNLTIKIENDGKTACYAETKYGALLNVNNGIFITIGRGIGGQIICNGSFINGQYGNGSKIGHILISKNGRKCNCGRKGCFESYCSVHGLIQTVKEFNNHMQDETMKIDESKLSGMQIVNYCKNKELVALSAVKKWNKDFFEGLLNLCMLFDPTIIVIAGGITESGLLNIEAIKNSLANYGYDKCEIKLSKFKGKAGLIGASCLLND